MGVCCAWYIDSKEAVSGAWLTFYSYRFRMGHDDLTTGGHGKGHILEGSCRRMWDYTGIFFRHFGVAEFGGERK